MTVTNTPPNETKMPELRPQMSTETTLLRVQVEQLQTRLGHCEAALEERDADLQAAREKLAQSIAAAAGGHCLFDLEQFRPAVEALEAAGRTSEVKDGKLHWTLNSKHWDAQRLFEILDKAPATPPAPQRLAQGEDWQQRCLDLGFVYGRAPDDHWVECTQEQAAALLRDVLGVDARFTTQPPHHDRGQVDGHVAMLRSLRLMYADGVMEADDHPGTLSALDAAIAALTEAKQQAPGEAVTARARFSGGDWRSCSVEHAQMVLANKAEWPDYEVQYLYTAPQVEAKRLTGEGESPSLKRIIPAAHPYPKPDQVTGADTGSIGEHAYADGWNDCRKAMIAAAAKPSGEVES